MARTNSKKSSPKKAGKRRMTRKANKSGRRQSGAGCPSPNGATARYFQSSCNASNVHNTHPEADLSMVQGKGLLPGFNQGGGAQNGGNPNGTNNNVPVIIGNYRIYKDGRKEPVNAQFSHSSGNSTPAVSTEYNSPRAENAPAGSPEGVYNSPNRYNSSVLNTEAQELYEALKRDEEKEDSANTRQNAASANTRSTAVRPRTVTEIESNNTALNGKPSSILKTRTKFQPNTISEQSHGNNKVINPTPSKRKLAKRRGMGERGYGPNKVGGGCSNPSEEPITFKAYLDEMTNMIGGGGSGGEVIDNYTTGAGGTLEHSIDAAHHGGEGSSRDSQLGGSGYSINPENMIGGLPTVDKYDRCCPPAIIGGRLVQSATGQSLCGSQIGAGKKKSGGKKKSSRKTKRGKKTTKKTARKTKKTKHGKKNKRRARQRGGLAPLDKAFEGEPSNFDHLAEGKDFGARQPNWSPEGR